MGQRRPSVREGLLQVCNDDTTPAPAISLHSPAWFTWLEGHSIFVYESPFLHFTARKERRASGAYWYAYRRQGGKLHTAYLGKSEELTLERLSAVASGMQQVENATRVPAATPAAVSTLAAMTPGTTTRDLDVPSAPHPSSFLRPSIQPSPGLPVPLTPLIGREVDAARAAALLRSQGVRLLTMVGHGGIGKTRLALQVAAEIAGRFADGVYLVPLAEVRDPQLVLPAVARTLGIKTEPDISVADLLKAALRQKELLLVLDNFEQLMPAASYLWDLLTACPTLKIMVTSREVLHLCGEQPFPVGPLAFPDPGQPAPADLLRQCPSVSLFLQRAEAIAPGTGIAASPATIRAVAQICTRLEGLPLAIELAAARVKLLPPQALVTRLERRLDVLTGGGADMAERHKSLRSTFAWSHDLLTAEEQSVFRRLSIFVGGCTLEAAQAVCNAWGDLTSPFLDLISSLVDKSMLQTDRREAQTSRVYMLDTVREYALECLLESGELQPLRKAHAAYYSGYVLRAWPWEPGDKPGQAANCSAHEGTSMVRTLSAYGTARCSQGENRPARLTNREFEALLLLAEGLSNDQIALRLVISTATVKTYLSAIYNKLGVSSRTAAMRFVIDHLPGAHAASLLQPQAGAVSSHAS